MRKLWKGLGAALGWVLTFPRRRRFTNSSTVDKDSPPKEEVKAPPTVYV